MRESTEKLVKVAVFHIARVQGEADVLRRWLYKKRPEQVGLPVALGDGELRVHHREVLRRVGEGRPENVVHLSQPVRARLQRRQLDLPGRVTRTLQQVGDRGGLRVLDRHPDRFENHENRNEFLI